MGENGFYRVVVAEDEHIILEDTIDKIGKADSRFNVVASAMNGEDALGLVASLKPDALFTDIRMPVLDGLELIRQARSLHPEMEIVIVSGYSDFAYAQQAIKLGVTDYLLKPLRMDALTETVESLKIKLDLKAVERERETLLRCMSGMKPPEQLPPRLAASELQLYLICLGNLYERAIEVLDAEYFHRLWSLVDWTSLLSQCLAQESRGWVLDDKIANKKWLVVAKDREDGLDEGQAAEKIREVLTQYVLSSVPATICTDSSPVSLSSLRDKARHLATALDNELVPFRSAVIRRDEKRPSDVAASSLPLDALNAVRKLESDQRSEWLDEELRGLFGVWHNDRMPQRQVEQALSQLTRGLMGRLGADAEQASATAIQELHELVAVSGSWDELRHNVLHAMQSLLQPQSKTPLSTEGLVESMEQFFRANLAKPISMTDLADKFNFNPSYLIRVFKKMKGEPPMQYFASLRIQEAKRLIETKPDLDFKLISEIVGYSDSHYFSRAFKNMTGQSPSEYRESLKDN
ncbi:response regulator [Cohnella soli]|uniref:Response regulator n=1 Tax=Cohnella soli TaxID=425005 RepID=A0ABW0HWP7_9BACL